MTNTSTATDDFISDTELRNRGMKRPPTWVRDETYSKAKRSDADRKKAERDKRKLEKNEKQVTVWTSDDEKVIATLTAVAKTIMDPRAHAVISAVVVDDTWLRWLINAVSITRFRELSGLSTEEAEKRWRDVRSAIEIAVNRDGIVELIQEIASGIDRLDLARTVMKAGPELRTAIAAVAASNPRLVDLIVEIAKGKGQDDRLEQAVTVAAREPDLVVGLKSVLQAGGLRSWIVRRIIAN
jgi:hypothetical protein